MTEAVVDALKSFAWPLAAIIIVCLLKKPISALILMIESVDIKGMKLKIRKQTLQESGENLEKEAKDASLPDETLPHPPTVGIPSVNAPLPNYSMEVVKSAIRLAEDLAIRKMEYELAIPITREVQWGGASPISLDGFSIHNHNALAFEVKYIRTVSFDLEIISKTLAVASRLINEAQVYKEKTKFYLVVVSDVPENKVRNLECRLESLTKNVGFPFELRVFRFIELKREFRIIES